MRPAFHEQATIFGYVGDELFAGPIKGLFDWNDQSGPAGDFEPRIASIEITGTIATARLEIDNWSSHRFTGLLTLLEEDGRWKIMKKVFHLHG